jgi:hypothetical protein
VGIGDLIITNRNGLAGHGEIFLWGLEAEGKWDGVVGGSMGSILAGFLQIGICKSLANSGFKKVGLTGLDWV